MKLKMLSAKWRPFISASMHLTWSLYSFLTSSSRSFVNFSPLASRASSISSSIIGHSADSSCSTNASLYTFLRSMYGNPVGVNQPSVFNSFVATLISRHPPIEFIHDSRTRHVTWQPLLGLLSLYPVMSSSFCNSFEDRAPVDFIYGCLIFKGVAVTWLKHGAPE